MNDLPVILSYFAQSQDQVHLDMLQQEQNTIQLAWENAPNPIEVKYLPRPSDLSNRDQIIEDIKKYGRRIVLFQFSGHAGPDAIQLNDGAGGPEGIAELLKNYAPNLKVVVLNGCSTHGQVETLFEQGIRAVVATSSAVNDKHATQFAISFHKTLCEGKSIQEAFRDAISVLKTKKLDQLLPQDIHIDAVSRSMLNTSAKAGTLWGLFTQDNGEDNVSNSNWWVISGRPDVNQPPANFIEAAKYVELKSELDEANNNFAKTKANTIKYPDIPEFQIELIAKDAKRSEIQKKIDGLKDAVLKLADEFTRIPINTERLRLAKAHFDAGEYEKARAVFDTEIELMKVELDALLDNKERLADEIVVNQKNLLDKANEYLILAQLTAINYDLPDRFEKTREFIILSLRAARRPENLFVYGNFLREHHQFNEALPFYEEALEIRRELAQINPQAYLSNLADLLNNLALLLVDLNEFDQASYCHEEALEIYQQLVQTNPQDSLPKVADSLNNLAVYFAKLNEFDLARSHDEAALEIYQQLAQTNPQDYLPKVADSLNNLANILEYINELDQAKAYHEEALEIRRQLAQTNPQDYLPKVADSLNNLALSLLKFDELDQAKAYHEEALEIRRKLTQTNPQAYLSDLADSLNNLAELLVKLDELEQARSHDEEALEIYQQLAQTNPQAYLPRVANSLNNLANILVELDELDQAQAHYEEALEIYQQSAQANILAYLPGQADSLNNLAELLVKLDELDQAQAHFEEALEIRRQLAYTSSQAHLPGLANSLNNLANILEYINELDHRAQAHFEEALEIYQQLARTNPQDYLPSLAHVALRLSLFFYQDDKSSSLSYAEEALRATLSFKGTISKMDKYAQTAFQIIERWGEDPDAFLQRVKDSMKPTD